MKNIAFIISLFGILILLAIINFTEPKTSDILDIKDLKINKKVKIIGTTNNVKIFENNFTRFSINDETGKINVICNCPNIKKNQTLEITGRVTKYKDNLQIQADLIKIVI